MKLINSIVLATALVSNVQQTLTLKKTYNNTPVGTIQDPYNANRTLQKNNIGVNAIIENLYKYESVVITSDRIIQVQNNGQYKEEVKIRYLVKAELTGNFVITQQTIENWTYNYIPFSNVNTWSVIVRAADTIENEVYDTFMSYLRDTDMNEIAETYHEDMANDWITDIPYTYWRNNLGNNHNPDNVTFEEALNNTWLAANSYMAATLNEKYNVVDITFETRLQDQEITSPNYLFIANTLPSTTSVIISYVANINTTQEVIDIPGLMFSILGMPFAWISTAFNLTLFPNTAYAINISHIFFAIIGSLILIYIIKKVIK